jgi:hypothetical protein
MGILGKLFGSKDIVKILRLFLSNATEPFEVNEVVRRTRVSAPIARREMAMLAKIGFLKKKVFYKKEVTKRRANAKEVLKKKKTVGWMLDERFKYLYGLQQLLTGNVVFSKNDIAQRLGRAGHMKLVITSGIFVRDADSRVDLLVVADGLKRSVLESVVRNMEAELGKELRCAIFSTTEFKYRLSIYDRLIRDIFDFPHEVILDKVGAA